MFEQNEQSSYPVTQYLIERFYSSNNDLVPNGPNLLDHRNSEELFKVLVNSDNIDTNNNSIVTTKYDACEEYGEETGNDGFDQIALPSNSILNRFLIKCNKYLSFGKNSYGYENDLLIKDLQWERQNSISYDQWKVISLKLDEVTGRDQWKLHMESDLYDYALIYQLTESMKKFRLQENYSELLYLIRTNWKRNLGNLGNVNLYRHCNIGTKKIIEDYLKESELSIECLLKQNELDNNYVLGILQQTKRNIGKTALVLSGGATFGLFHIGILAALFEAEFIPKIISGTSAGAIVASIFCIHTKDEIPSLLANVLNMEFNIFKDEKDKSSGEDFLLKLSRFLKGGSWFDNKHLKNTMIEFLGNLTFQEAYFRTGKILNITVSPASIYEQPRLLNNLTAPNVLIWSAVCASCSVPGVFPATPLFEKDPQTGNIREWLGKASAKFVDGSVENDLPIPRLSEMFNIDHIIACQVNPHVFPLLKLSVSCVGGEIQNEVSAKFKQHLTNIFKYMTNEVIHGLDILSEFGIARNTTTKLASVLSQQYSGNITILPDISMLNQSHELLRNPSRSFLLRETTLGARATWPKLSMIKNSCGQEFLLDKAITYLQTKLLMSSSIKNPLQFQDAYNLIKLTDRAHIVQHHGSKIEFNQDPTLLDDSLIESENKDSLLFIRNTNLENLKKEHRLRSMSLRLNSNVQSLLTENGKLVTYYTTRPNYSKALSFSGKNNIFVKNRKRADTTTNTNADSAAIKKANILPSYNAYLKMVDDNTNILAQYDSTKMDHVDHAVDSYINRKSKNN